MQCTTNEEIINIEECVAKAKNADKIIICLGETPCTEIPGNINNLELPKAQETLVLKMLELNKPIILVCCFNRPRVMNNFISKVDAIIYTYLPGDEGGRVIADCLFGTINPSGKLPFTYPTDVNSIMHYDHKTSEDIATDFSMYAYNPPFDFGAGLSYSKFTYNNFVLSTTSLNNNDSVKISVTVKNESAVAGKEVVQVFYKDLFASITPAAKKLVAFKKISLEPNESKSVEFTLNKDDFSFVNKNLKRVTEAGDFEIMINNKIKTLHVN
jgi:beta-glucosidase